MKLKLEFESFLPPLSEEEKSLLKESLRTEGQRDPIVVWKRSEDDRVILDGHNRYVILAEMGVATRAIEKQFETQDEATIWILTNQRGRRNLTDDQRKATAALLYELRAKRSREERARGAASARMLPGPKGLGDDSNCDLGEENYKDS